MSFLKLLESGYIDEKPRHITDPNRSVFDVIASSDFQHLSTKEIQDRLRAKNIVVTGCENPTMMFDKPGFRVAPASAQAGLKPRADAGLVLI